MVEGAPAPRGGWHYVPDPLPLLWRHHPGYRDHRVPAAARQCPVRSAAYRALYLLATDCLRASARSRWSGGGSDAGRRSGLKKNTAPPIGRRRAAFWCRGWLQLHDILRRGAFLALHDFELHALAFGERLEAFSLNRRVMHEAVLAAVFRRDKPEPLGVVEPLHGTGDAFHLSVTP